MQLVFAATGRRPATSRVPIGDVEQLPVRGARQLHVGAARLRAPLRPARLRPERPPAPRLRTAAQHVYRWVARHRNRMPAGTRHARFRPPLKGPAPVLRTRTPTCVLTSAAAPRARHGHHPDRYVQIGSLTKVLTGTAFVRMAAAGLLNAADPVDRWLPAPCGTGITLQHLAEHTSGLPRQPPGLPGKDPYRTFDTDALH